MNIAEMHTAVKLGLDKTSSLTLPAFEPEEIDLWLNKAQERFVDMVYNEYKQGGTDSRFFDYLAPIIMSFSTTTGLSKPLNKDEASGIFSTNAIRKNLRVKYVANPNTPTVFTDYSDNIRYILSVYVTLSGNFLEDSTYASTGSLYKCDPIREEDSVKYLKTAVNIPYFENPVYYVTQDYGYASSTTTPAGTSWPTLSCKELVIIYNSFATGVGQVYINSVRNPNLMSYSSSSNCILPSIVHNKIVDLAVELMIENIESPRLQTNAQLLNI
jgi:hypothetical protein